MNEIIQAMLQRRSVRSFKSDLVSKEDLDQIVQAGLYAANGRGFQSAKLIVVTDQQLRNEIAEQNRRIGGWQDGFDPFYGAPVMIVVIADRSKPTYLYDGSLVMGNLMLASHALGLSSCWIHRAKEEFESEFGKSLLARLGITGEWEGIGHCAIGYADQPAPSAAQRAPERVYYL